MLRLGFLMLLALFYIGPNALPPSLKLEFAGLSLQSMTVWCASVLGLAAAGLTRALRAAVPTPAVSTRPGSAG